MKERSIREVIAHLEAQTKQLREREAWHAQQEAFHHGEQTRFAAELEAVSRHLESLRWAANLAAGALGKAAPAGHEDLGSASSPKLSRMVEKVLADLSPETRFGTRWMAHEVNRRFGSRLRKPADGRRISVVLRRFHRTGRLEMVRPGRPHWEALYVRTV
jgi:uncharacterized protein YukE